MISLMPNFKQADKRGHFWLGFIVAWVGAWLAFFLGFGLVDSFWLGVGVGIAVGIIKEIMDAVSNHFKPHSHTVELLDATATAIGGFFGSLSAMPWVVLVWWLF